MGGRAVRCLCHFAGVSRTCRPSIDIMKPPISGIRLERLKAKKKVREASLRGDRTLGERFKAAMWGPVQTVASRVRDFLASTEPVPAPVAVTKPVALAAPPAEWDKLVVSADSSPTEVESAMMALLAPPGANESRSDIIGRLDVFSKFLGEVGKIDASGRIIEKVDDSDPDEARKAARVIGKILGELLPAGRSQGTASSIKPEAAYKPMGQAGIEADIRREIAGTRTKSVATPTSAKTVPSVASPVTGGPISSRLSGSARAEAQIREALGQKPLAEHVALANKLSPINPQK